MVCILGQNNPIHNLPCSFFEDLPTSVQYALIFLVYLTQRSKTWLYSVETKEGKLCLGDAAIIKEIITPMIAKIYETSVNYTRLHDIKTQ